MICILDDFPWTIMNLKADLVAYKLALALNAVVCVTGSSYTCFCANKYQVINTTMRHLCVSELYSQVET